MKNFLELWWPGLSGLGVVFTLVGMEGSPLRMFGYGLIIAGPVIGILVSAIQNNGFIFRFGIRYWMYLVVLMIVYVLLLWMEISTATSSYRILIFIGVLAGIFKQAVLPAVFGLVVWRLLAVRHSRLQYHG